MNEGFVRITNERVDDGKYVVDVRLAPLWWLRPSFWRCVLRQRKKP